MKKAAPRGGSLRPLPVAVAGVGWQHPFHPGWAAGSGTKCGFPKPALQIYKQLLQICKMKS